MKQSELFTKTIKENPKDEKSINAQLLIRAGFIDKLGAGIYSYLPLGLMVIENIKKIVREEMNKIGGQEILMPSLHPKENWEITGRWGVEEMYKIKDENLGLGWTHEEIITPLVKKYATAFPKYIYQIQTKFRNEPRAKSGILRCREFLMKDLYSFHTSEDDLNDYYEKVKEAYFKIYDRCGLKEKTFLTVASGGEFSSSISHEFQTITESGEDDIYTCKNCGCSFNKEIFDSKCDCGSTEFEEKKSIEVGNIFKLGEKYSKPFNMDNIVMGCYGIGITRVMGAIVEVFNDDVGIIWPKEVAPFNVHLLGLDTDANEIYNDLQKNGIKVLYDDRNKSAGEKLNDCDLIGIPIRIILSKKTLEKNCVEIKRRNEDKLELVEIKKLIEFIKNEL
ncbi:MAG: prolyl-tRNA synthetase [Patescibacteria group bacterium]|nr:prolyl-tRNA synthetase [Patescibacteria group bacterium]